MQVLILAVASLTLGPQSQGPTQDALRRIEPDWIAPHVRFLASDLLEGRETSTRGARLAAEYVAAQIAEHARQHIAIRFKFQRF